MTSYPRDLTWKIFLWNFFWEKSTFHFLNLSPVLLSIGALNDPERPQKGNNEIYRNDVYNILVNLKQASKCLEMSKMPKMAKECEWLHHIYSVSAQQRAIIKYVMHAKLNNFTICLNGGRFEYGRKGMYTCGILLFWNRKQTVDNSYNGSTLHLFFHLGQNMLNEIVFCSTLI